MVICGEVFPTLYNNIIPYFRESLHDCQKIIGNKRGGTLVSNFPRPPSAAGCFVFRLIVKPPTPGSLSTWRALWRLSSRQFPTLVFVSPFSILNYSKRIRRGVQDFFHFRPRND